MSEASSGYTINEQDSERQMLLARVLEPLTRPVLERARIPAGARCLDLGCGQGNTSRLLAEVLQASEVVGVEYDANLVAAAASHAANSPAVRFEQGDATKLNFPDGSFDVVFTRYLLLHLTDPVAVIREMLRIAGPGGKVIAYEPDCATSYFYPPFGAEDRLGPMMCELFADARIGRKLVHHFRDAGARHIDAGCASGIEYEGIEMKRLFRLSVEAMRGGILAKNIWTPAECDAIISGLERLEKDPDCVVVKFPDFWVIASL